MKKIYLFLISVFAVLIGQAQTTWDGSTSADWNVASNWSTNSVPDANDDITIPNVTRNPVIPSGTAVTVKSVLVQSGGHLTISTSASLTTQHVAGYGIAGYGIQNEGTVINSGSITINSTGFFFGIGINNEGSFTNNAGSTINLNFTNRTGLLNAGMFTNAGQINVQTLGGQFGLQNSAMFNNNTGGVISLTGGAGYALENLVGGTFTNEAAITISTTGQEIGYGLHNEARFDNNTGGSINIDNTSIRGLYNETGVFINAATITISVAADLYAFHNDATFNNNACAILSLSAPFANTSVFTNAGLVKVNSAAGHVNNGFTNNGIIEYLQSNEIPNVTNNDLVVAPKTIYCGNWTNILNKGAALSFTPATIWYTNTNLTSVAGTYNLATNTFTPNFTLTGSQVLYFSVSDNASGCPRTVSITVTAEENITFWTGAGNTDWNNAANWTCGVPTATDLAVIRDAANDPVVTGTSAVAQYIQIDGGSLAIQASSTLTLYGRAGWYGIGVFSNGSVLNQGIINIGLTASINEGIRNQGSFTNNGIINTGATQTSVIGILNENSFINNGTVTLGSGAAVGTGIDNQSNFTNNGTLNVGTAAMATISIRNRGTFTNSTAATVTLPMYRTVALLNDPDKTFINNGTITIGSQGSGTPVQFYDKGLENRGAFTNDAAGQVNIQQARTIGLYNPDGSFTNFGHLTLSASTPVGLHNLKSFSNEAGAGITIENATSKGLLNTAANPYRFLNSGTIIIGASSSTAIDGLRNEGNFTNNGGGEILISQSQQNNLYNAQNRFDNQGTITLGTVASANGTGYSLRNDVLFFNLTCGKIYLNGTFYNGINTFDNQSLLQVNSTGVHVNNGSFLNNRLLVYAPDNLNTIPNVTNNDVIVNRIAQGCNPAAPALQLSGNSIATFGTTWYSNPPLTLPAGTYNPSANAFTWTVFPAAGTYTLYFTVIYNLTCSFTVPISITIAAGPNAGLDQVLPCGQLSTLLSANRPAPGSTGLWSIQSGAGGSVANTSDPRSSFSGSPGVTYTLRWTFTSPTCGSSSDDVQITFGGAPGTYYRDADGDGYGNANDAIQACSVPAGYVANHDDCNDDPAAGGATIHRGATEACDGIDNDCDGQIDEGFTDTDNDGIKDCVDTDDDNDGVPDAIDCAPLDASKWRLTILFVDADNDNFTVGDGVTVCYGAVIPIGYKTDRSETDDCNDGKATVWQSLNAYIDSDNDNYAAGSAVICFGATLPQGYKVTVSGTDCDDTDPTKHASFPFYVDTDGDGYGAGNAVSLCAANASTAPAGYSITNTDCAPADNTRWRSTLLYVDTDGDTYTTGSTTVCYGAAIPNGYRVAANGNDCNDNDPTVWQSATLYRDADGDGYTVGDGEVKCYGASLPTGWIAARSTVDDCNDNDYSLNPATWWYLDADGDQFAISRTQSCTSPGTGYTRTALPLTDCDDGNANEFPGQTWYIDRDGDGFAGSTQVACERPLYGKLPSQLAGTATDCNDTNADEKPGQSWYIDGDNDGYPGASVTQCARPANGKLLAELTGNTTDCADNITAVSPGVLLSITAPADITNATSNSDGTGDCATTVMLGTATHTDNCTPPYTLQPYIGTTLVMAATKFPVGTTVVTWKLTNNTGGVVATKAQIVTVLDNEAPVVSLKDGRTSLTVNLTKDCKIQIPTNLYDYLNLSDNCGIRSTVSDPVLGTEWPSVDGASFYVSVTVTDVNGNETPFQVHLLVNDANAPAFTAPANRDVSLNGSCKIVVPDLVTGLTATSGCGTVLFSQSPLAGTEWSSSHNQTLNVIITATTAGGTTQKTVVLTAKDITNPVLAPAANQNVNMNTGVGACSITVPDVRGTATDNCTVSITQSPAVNEVVSANYNSTVVVTITAKDAANNTDVKYVTLTAVDVTPPVLTPAANREVNMNTAAASCSITVPDVRGSATDNCTGTVITQSPLAGATVAASHNSTIDVTVTATDAAGLTNVKTVVLTAKDVTNPTITAPVAITNAKTSDDGTGDCTTTVRLGTPTVGDNCGTPTVKAYVNNVVINPATYAFGRGTTVVTWEATDAANLKATATQAVTVADDEKPTITAPADKIVPETDAGQCTKTGVSLGTPGTGDNCSGTLTVKAYVGSTVITPGTYPFPFGTTVVTWEVKDAAGNTQTATQQVTVQKVKTTATVTVSPSSQQYSDKVTFTATVTPSNCGSAGDIGGTVAFKIGNLVLGEAPVVNGMASLTAPLLEDALYDANLSDPLNATDGPLKPGAKQVTALFSTSDADYVVSNPTPAPLVVTCEDADVTYTGGTFFTVNPSTFKGTVFLSTTANDKNDAPAQARGDIRNATITFRDGGSSGTIKGEANEIPVGLIDPANRQEGIATTNFAYTLTTSDQNAGGKVFNMWVGANNYYCGSMAGDLVPVTLGIPGQDFVTGGGYIVLSTNASGKYGVGTAGMKMNAGLVMKWNPSGKNLQGNINIIFRRMENGVKKIYQIKSNAINSLVVENVNDAGAVVATGNTFRKATITTKANFTDITNPLTPVSIGGNLDLLVTAWESTTVNNGSLDRISIQLTGSGSTGMLFSSNWSGGKTAPQTLNGGKMQVRNNATAPALPATTRTRDIDASVVGNSFTVKAFPNPTTSFFNMEVFSNNTTDVIHLKVVDLSGRLIEMRNHLQSGQTLHLGEKYRPGMYFVEVLQGNRRNVLKLVKQPE